MTMVVVAMIRRRRRRRRRRPLPFSRNPCLHKDEAFILFVMLMKFIPLLISIINEPVRNPPFWNP